MAKITEFQGYQGSRRFRSGRVGEPNIVTVQDGVPVKYPGCEGIGVRVVHPSNPRAPAENLGMVMFFVPPTWSWEWAATIPRNATSSEGAGDHDAGRETGPR